MLRKFKVAVVVRTLVRIGSEQTEVRATLKVAEGLISTRGEAC